MRKLWTFGDSFTADYEYDQFDSHLKYKNILGHEIKTWPTILSEKLGVLLYNRGAKGSSNFDIFNNFIDNSNNFRPQDIVIVGWALITKFKFVHNDILKTIHPDTEDEFLKKIIENRKHPLWQHEIHQYMKFMINFCYQKKIHIYFWSSEDENLLYGENAIKKYEYDKNSHIIKNDNKIGLIFDLISKGSTTIEIDTKGIIKDSHLGEKGHDDMANLFYNHILQNKHF